MCTSEDMGADMALLSSNLLLAGNGATNRFTRDYFDSFKGLRYVISHGNSGPAVEDRLEGIRINPDFQNGKTGLLLRDPGVLTVMRNPASETRTLIGCVGAHGYGTLACLKAVSERDLLRKLFQTAGDSFRGNGFQLVLEYEVDGGRVVIRSESLHRI
jgi:hypothetical protein